MATYTITTVNPGSQFGKHALAGEALAAGDWIYIKESDGKAYKADCNVAEANADVVGMCINTAAINQPVNYAINGEITVDTGLFAGKARVLALSQTAGKACDIADLTTDDWLTLLGHSSDTNKLIVAISAKAIQRT